MNWRALGICRQRGEASARRASAVTRRYEKVIAMQQRRKLRAEKHDYARRVDPRQQGDGGADRTIQQIVMKVRERECEAEFRAFPEYSGDDGSRQRLK